MDEEGSTIDANGEDISFILNEFGYEVAVEVENETNAPSPNRNPLKTTATSQEGAAKKLKNCSVSYSFDGEDLIKQIQPSDNSNQCSNTDEDISSSEDHPELLDSGEITLPCLTTQHSLEGVDDTTFQNHPTTTVPPKIIVSDCSMDASEALQESDKSNGQMECSECLDCSSQVSQSLCPLHLESSRIGNETTLAMNDCPAPSEDDVEIRVKNKISSSSENSNSIVSKNQTCSESKLDQLNQESKPLITPETQAKDKEENSKQRQQTIYKPDRNDEVGTKLADSFDSQNQEFRITKDFQTTTSSSKAPHDVESLEELGQSQKFIQRSVSVETRSSGVPEEDGETIVMAGEPPDGGYGWVIVFAVFTISVVHPSVSTCFGLVLAQIQEETGGELYTNSQLVWIPTILFALRQLLAPASSRLAEHFGIRAVSCTGGLLLSLGLLLSAFSKLQLSFLYLSYGSVMGVGLTLLVPQTVLISQTYFTKKRVAALAIGTMGVSLGNVTMPMFLQWALTTYGVEATFMLWSGITLQTVVATLLFHPVRRHLKAKPVPLKTVRSSQMLYRMPLRRSSSMGSSKVPRCNCGSSVCESMSAYGTMLPNDSQIEDHEFRTMFETHDEDESLQQQDRSYNREISCFSPIKAPVVDTRSLNGDKLHKTSLDRTWSNPGVDSPKTSTKKSLSRHKSTSERELEVLPVILEERSDTEGGIYPLQSSHEDISKSYLRPKWSGVTQSRPGSRSSGRSLESFATCRDSFATCRSSAFSDSVYCSLEMLPTSVDGQSVSSKLPETRKLWKKRISSYRNRLPSWRNVWRSTVQEFKDMKMSYSEVLSQKVFIISCAASCLSRLTYTNFNTFLPLVGEEVGLKDDKVYLLMAVAAFDLFAKIVTAIISTCTDVSTRTLYVIGGVISTLACLGVSVSQGLTSLLISSGLYGLGLGVQMSTSAVLLVEFLGIRLLAKSFGLTLFFVGTTGLALMPLGGVLQDAVGNYRSTYYFLTVFAAGPALLWTLGLKLVQWLDQDKDLQRKKKKKRQWFNQTDPLAK